MKTLKIKDKLLIGIIGQFIFIALLIYFIFSLNLKLKNVTEQKVQSINEVNSIKELTLLTKDFLSKKIDFNTLKKTYERVSFSTNNSDKKKVIKTIWEKLENIKVNNDSNLLIEEQVMDLTDFSIKQSNAFISEVSKKLADTDERKKVTAIERLTIAGANGNTSDNFNTKVLFLKLKEDISNKDALLEFLNMAVEQARADIEKLANTPFAELPIKATEANLRTKKLTEKFISNTEENTLLSNEIFALTNQIFKELNEDDLISTKEIFNQVKSSIGSILIVLLIISIAIIALNFVLSRIISDVFSKLPENLNALAKGDLTKKVPEGFEKRKDEIGILVMAYNQMITNLKNIVSEIKNGSENIASASQQINSTSEQMSQGASEQASSVEEISSTMEQIAANIEQNSENAGQTEKIASIAQEGIQDVSKQSLETVNANKLISEKISIITDIAFQTNILALNAAVEAARAGEHGKGFAVVAAEVRKLAERSKVAAEEIVKLAKNSYELAESAGKKMEKILPEVIKTTQLVQEISSASQEQSNGATQVNSAIQQLNTVTQQNAAASEELATSAEEMNSQAEQLKDLVAFFRVNSKEIKNVLTRQHTQNSKTVKTNESNNVKEINKKVYAGLNMENSVSNDKFEHF